MDKWISREEKNGYRSIIIPRYEQISRMSGNFTASCAGSWGQLPLGKNFSESYPSHPYFPKKSHSAWPPKWKSRVCTDVDICIEVQITGPLRALSRHCDSPSSSTVIDTSNNCSINLCVDFLEQLHYIVETISTTRCLAYNALCSIAGALTWWM